MRVLVFLLISHICFAQKKDSLLLKASDSDQNIPSQTFNKKRYNTGGFHFSYAGFQDTRMSPLIYRGIGGAFDFQTISYSDKSFKSMQLKFLYNLMYSKVSGSQALHFGGINFNYNYQRRIKKVKERFYVGGTVENIIGARLFNPLGNNAFGFHDNFVLSPLVSYVWEEFINKNWNLIARGGFGVFSLSLRYPEYAYTGIEFQVLGIGKYNRYFFEIGISPRLKNSMENRFYFSYLFDAYSFSSSNDDKKLAQYQHGFKFSYFLKTK